MVICFTGNTNFLTKSLHALSKDTMLQWLQDPVSSRLMEQFLKSKQVSLKSKRKIIYLLQGHYGTLALDKYGSHWIELGWTQSDLKLKEIMASEILVKEREIRDSQYGKFTWYKFKMDLFKRRKQDWSQLFGGDGQEKKRELFKEFLE